MKKLIVIFIAIILSIAAVAQGTQQEKDTAQIADNGHNDSLISDLEQSINEWRKSSVADMQQETIEKYAKVCYYLGKHGEGLDIARQGLKIYPTSLDLNRTAMMCCAELEAYDIALKYSKPLFKENNILFDSDYYYHGKIFEAKGFYENALQEYKKAMGLKKEHYLIGKDIITKCMLECYINLGTSYVKEIQSSKGKEQTKIYMKADSLFEDFSTTIPEATEYATFMRARINTYIDSDLKKGLALPYYKKVIELISSRQIKSDSDKLSLSEAYRYMISYYVNIKQDGNTAKDYGMKLYELDPESPIAKEILGL